MKRKLCSKNCWRWLEIRRICVFLLRIIKTPLLLLDITKPNKIGLGAFCITIVAIARFTRNDFLWKRTVGSKRIVPKHNPLGSTILFGWFVGIFFYDRAFMDAESKITYAHDNTEAESD